MDAAARERLPAAIAALRARWARLGVALEASPSEREVDRWAADQSFVLRDDVRA